LKHRAANSYQTQYDYTSEFLNKQTGFAKVSLVSVVTRQLQIAAFHTCAVTSLV